MRRQNLVVVSVPPERQQGVQSSTRYTRSNLVRRKEFVKLSGEAKLDLIIRLSENASINAANLTERARSYVQLSSFELQHASYKIIKFYLNVSILPFHSVLLLKYISKREDLVDMEFLLEKIIT